MLDVGRGAALPSSIWRQCSSPWSRRRGSGPGSHYAALGVLDPSGKELEGFLTVGEETRRKIGRLPRGHGVLGVLISEPQPLRLAEVGASTLVRAAGSYGWQRLKTLE